MLKEELITIAPLLGWGIIKNENKIIVMVANALSVKQTEEAILIALKNDPMAAIKLKTLEKNHKEILQADIDPIEELENIVDDAIKEVKSLKEDEEIYPEIKKTIENEIPQEIKKEFDNLAKSLENKKTMTEKENIVYEVRELRNDIDVLNRRITKRHAEDMDIMKMIFDRLRFLKRHVSKWFVGMLLITFVSGGVIFTSTYHNWDTIAPQIDKLVNLVKIGNSITRTGG